MAPALQISIPETSTGTDSSRKAYTVYHIALTLPIRTHNIKKRYSDFTTLHANLQSQTGQAPPTSLPPKSWLKSTINSPALTEDRRKGLENYLRSILSCNDNRWRQSPAWREFLNLPNQGPVSSLDDKSQTQRHTSLSSSEWLDVHRDVKTQIHTARLVLKKRDGAQTASEQHGLSAEAKAALVKAAAGIARCEDALRTMGKSDVGSGWDEGSKLGEGEIRRRRDLLGASRKEVEGLETAMRSLNTKGANGTGVGAAAAATDGDKEALWKGTGTNAGAGGKPGRVLGGPVKETERTRELDNDGVLQLQKQVMDDQEQDVLEIGKAVSRMKEMGIMINEELVVQNQMLGLLEQDVDRVDGKISVAKKRIGKIH